jgi:hypothetical protein
MAGAAAAVAVAVWRRADNHQVLAALPRRKAGHK